MEATQIEITPEMQMGEIIGKFPSAKRALFQKYHIGGCHSCGYAMNETLEEVLIKHNRPGELSNAIQEIYESARVDEMMQISVEDLKKELDEGAEWRLLDVRDEYEAEIASLPNSEILSQELAYEMLQKWPRDTKILFYCHTGIRSLEAASYFKGHGLANVKSLKGGIDRWAEVIDTSLARY